MEIRMRFLSLFLTISLFINIPLYADPAPSNPGIFSKAKELAYKAAAYAKKGGEFLISPEGQALLIAAYGATYFIKTLGMRSSKTSQVAVSDLPEAMQEAVRGMNPQHKITFHRGGKDCYAQGNHIVLAERLFSYSPEIQKYIMGHEITHIEKNHALKGVIGTYAIVFGVPLILGFAKLKFDQMARNTQKDTIKSKCILAAKKVTDFVANNPIIPFAIIMTLCSRLSQYTEKEADIVSATKLNCAQGAVDYANHCIKGAKERTASASWASYFSPFAIADSISDALGWTRHDSRTKALEYLVPLAEQQKAVA